MKIFSGTIAVLLCAALLFTAFATGAAACIPMRGLATVTVADEAGAPVAGAKYTLYRSAGGVDYVIGTYVTDQQGRITASHLTTGDYFWLAYGAPEGFVQDKEVRSFKMVGNGHADLKVSLKSGPAFDLDCLVLVNKNNPLPSYWEDALQIVKTVNSLGDEVETERTAYEAYLKLKAALLAEGIFVDLDSAYRSVAAQQAIVVSFTEKYGADYVKQYVAVPGYSEHHTGLALDLYLIIGGEDVYLNEDMVEYPEIWAKIHEKLADFGFILRYPEGKEAITGYSYEPWHIRYVGAEAEKVMRENGETLEEYLGEAPRAVVIDCGTSALYTAADMDAAIAVIRAEFDGWEGCELHAIRYEGDECCTEENLNWLNSLRPGAGYTEYIAFRSDFHSPVEAYGAWEADTEYENWEWCLGRTENGSWELVSWGY